MIGSAVWIAAAGFVPPTAALAQTWTIDWEAAREAIAGVLDRVDETAERLQREWSAQIREDIRTNIENLLGQADAALQGLSEEDMAELEPWLRSLAEHAAEIPELAPYASWLSARLDYFAAARHALAVSTPPAPQPPRARPPPPAPPPRPASPPPWRRPSPAPVRPPASPSVARSRARAESDRTAWRARVASKARPPRTDELVPQLKRAFRSEKVPEALVWIAEVESAMDPQARSPRGALGLFQLTGPTARSLGLRLEPEDERTDPVRSAGAAARYLRQLHGRFGSWPLALAAYNAGQGRVGALLKNSGGTTFDDIVSGLPLETRMYVPKVLETLRACEGVDPDRLPPPG